MSRKVIAVLSCALVTLIGAMATVPTLFGVGEAKSGGLALFGFGLLGSGPLSTNCDSETSICSSSLNAIVNGNAIGNGAVFTDSMTWSLDSAIIGAGQACYAAAGTGTIVAKGRGQINFSFSGLLCGNSETFVPSSLNGTYIVTGGTRHFANAAGSGNFTQNNFIVVGDAKTHPQGGATVSSGPAAIVRFDGLLTPRQPGATPTRTATISPTPVVTVTPTPVVTVTPTPVVTVTPTPAATITPTMTVIPSSTPLQPARGDQQREYSDR
jgi:hypothetical protein